MTREQITDYIEKDIRKISKERKQIVVKKATDHENLRGYLITRQNTLKEILSLLKQKSPRPTTVRGKHHIK